jgi:hypothetical protein
MIKMVWFVALPQAHDPNCHIHKKKMGFVALPQARDRMLTPNGFLHRAN